MKRFFKVLSTFLTITLTFVLGICIYSSASLPNNYKINEDCDFSLKSYLSVKVSSVSANKDVDADSFDRGSYDADVLLMNVIPIKRIHVERSEQVSVVPCGCPFGVKIFTKGVMVVGVSDVKSDKGIERPAKDAGIKSGDIILSVNGFEINSNDDFIDIVENCNGDNITTNILRDGENFNAVINPAKNISDGNYKVGLWVRDSSAGIGTLTFYEPETLFYGGLGHGICDVDTGELMPLLHGEIIKATINGITKGVRGIPGELKGYFIDTGSIGEIDRNTNIGVYGTLNEKLLDREPIVVALKQQVKTGEAEVLTTVSGATPKTYSIEIQSINYNEDSPNKNMIIKVVDERLINETGGIIQGMSGSPIIQNGMLVGAITHVFVNDPQKGYAIFAENMVSKCENAVDITNKKAS